MYSPNSEESYDQPLDFSKNAASVATPVSRIQSQPLVTSIHIKQERNHHPYRRAIDRHHSTDSDDDEDNGHRNRTSSPIAGQQIKSPREPPVSNCFTTPSPSPPEHNPNQSSHHANQVLCQLLTGGLIPTSTGKLMAGHHKGPINPLALQQHLLKESAAIGHRLNGHISETSPVMSSSPPTHPRTTSTSSAAVMQAFEDRHNTSSRSPTGSESPIGLGPLNQVEMHYSQSPPNGGGVDRFGTSGGLLTTATNAANMFANDAAAKRSMKFSRPFKAYPRDPLSMNPVMGFYAGGMPLSTDTIATQSLLATASDQAYLQFREQMLISRKSSSQPEPTRRTSGTNGQSKSNCNASSTATAISPDSHHKPNGNNNSNNNYMNNINQNSTNYYTNRSLTSPPHEVMGHTLGPKPNGSSTPAMTTPTNTTTTTAKTTPQPMHTDDTSQYSNGNSSGNSSGGEGLDLGSKHGSHNGQHYQDGDGTDGEGNGSARKRGRPLPEDLKDDAYWERRRKNNEAAKRSRDARRAKEDEIAIRAAFLEQENLKLRCEIAQLKTETTKLRCLLSVNSIDRYSKDY